MCSHFRPAIPFLFTVFGLLFSMLVSAQLKGFGIGPYIEFGNPSGRSGAGYQSAYGGGLSAVVKLPAKLALTAAAGYLRVGAGRMQVPDQQGGSIPKTLNALPLRAGLRFRPIPLFFVKAEAGRVHFTGGNDDAFLFSPGLGIRIAGLELQASRETWYDQQKISFWALRAGISF